ncbi:transcription-repair coupling factor [Spirochaeta lutea]|uniref:Transcription-repair-coupling factor n=1 Tax=Spirochaeta lutea TaxID=1480694 RepID=A0A098R109_9SPIO|nr:transcription-repair coupling factor [Spirochaeta lutea]KGE73684.1 transcription-repair coupling factor [Spirochaeta lutea]
MDSLMYRRISQKLKDLPSFKDLTTLLGPPQSHKKPVPESGDLVGNTLDLTVSGIQGSFLAILLSRLVDKGHHGMLLVLPTEKEAEQLSADLASLGVENQIWPWTGTASYSPLPKNSPVFGRRVRLLTNLANRERQIILTSLRGLVGFLPPSDVLRKSLLTLRKRMHIQPTETARELTHRGYTRVSKVSLPGEYALRGEVLDIMLPGEDYGFRIVYSFDQIEEIRSFDVSNQSSIKKLDEVTIHSSREVIWNEERITQLEQTLARLPELKSDTAQILEAVRNTPGFEGEELWYPLSFEKPVSLIEYIPDSWPVFFLEFERLLNAEEALHREFDSLYRKLRHSQPLPRPERLLEGFNDIVTRTPRKVTMPVLRDFTKDSAGQILHFNSDGPRSFFGNIEFLQDELTVLSKSGYEIFVITDSEVQSLRLKTLLNTQDIHIEQLGLRSGFTLPDLRIVVIQENEIFGRRKRAPRSVKQVKSEAIESFVDLEPGDFIVHVNHGIGRFFGIQRIQAAGTERDYIKLEYADSEYIFVPIEQVNLIQRYIGSQGNDPRLDKIGGKSWENRKARVSKRVEDLAAHLINLYSRRRRAQGFAFPEDSEWQIQFESTFPFEETVDQLRCIEEVKADMEKPLPMDRLICGDVGYGKTEIAMRAAFKAVASGKQVAFLAPTTILAEQHLESLQERLEGFPVNLGMLSRFVSKADQRRVLGGVEEGSVDILVGTHRIIQKDVRFKDLGLLIVDEEQRFGVKDKERLKELKYSVDSLTMSATPIPRTLHMSLLKIRDMSVLKTPPHNRRPIETYVEAFNDELVAKAIRREIQRGGQVFFLHNRVETLENIQLFLEKLVPEVLVETAHGKMSSKELEDIMHRFIHGGFQVLVATTIIENGINIPNVNTIIIDRADMYGISQLYQLRGRVGRSDRLAYAYLFYPEQSALSELAMKRLQIISDYTELGSGFKIALKDLEVRGAGNLLGAEQSGDIYSVGFDLYLRLLDEAVRRLAKEEIESRRKAVEAGEDVSGLPELPPIEDEQIQETYLELEYTGFIPDSYITEPMEKMEVYKKISAVASDEELSTIQAEIEDRFGPTPEEVQSLLSLAELRVLCAKLYISSLKERRGSIEIEFGKMAKINIQRLVEMVQTSGGAIKPVPNKLNAIRMKSDGIGLKEKSEFLRGRLSQLLR